MSGMESFRYAPYVMKVKSVFFDIVSLDVEHTIVRFDIEVGRFPNETVG